MVDNLLTLNSISKNRNALMGIAIIWVFLFHVGGVGLPIIDNVLLKGYLGVDIFFFLSGWGVCFSLFRNNNIKDFYKRRLVRILPSWYIIITLMMVLHIIMKLQHPHCFIDLLLYYSGLGYFTQSIFSEPSIFVRYYEWYIPTLLMFYLFAPIIHKLSIKLNIILLVLSIACVIFINTYCNSPVYSMSYSRIPVYIGGFIACKLNMEKKCPPPEWFWVANLSALTLIILYYSNCIVSSVEFLIVLLLMPSFLSIMTFFIKITNLNNILSFIGSISLELYLLHIYNRLLRVIDLVVNQRAISIFITIIVLIGVAYTINRLSSIISKKISKNA